MSQSVFWPPSGSGSVSVPSVGTNGLTAPTSSDQAGGVDGGGILRALSVDSTGKLNANISSSVLPTGAATEATLAAMSAKLPAALGQTTMAGSMSVALASNQSSIPVAATLQAGSAIAGKFGIDQTTVGTTNAISLAQIGATTVATGNGVAGTGVQRVTIASDNTAFSVNATLSAGAAIIGKVSIDQTTVGTTNAVSLAQIGANTVLTGNGVSGTGSQRVNIASDNTPFPVKIDQTTVGTTNAMSLAQIGATTIASGNGVSGAGVQRVAIASDNTAFSVNATVQASSNIIGNVRIDQTTVGTTNGVSIAQIGANTVLTGAGTTGTGSQRVTQANAATATITSVAGSATSVNLLASNTARRGGCFFNDSTATAYLKLGATASTSSYTVQLVAGAYYELLTNACYTGAIDCIWSAANGNMRITEIS